MIGPSLRAPVARCGPTTKEPAVAGPTRVALALGSGGARGYAHIGVIQVLEERGYEIVGIAGTSMGAVVGGLYAAGRLDDYTDWVSSLGQRDVLRLLELSLKGPGAVRTEKIFDRVSELLGGAVIEELAIPFTAVATDLLTGKEVWFQQGPVDAAIRASTALPSFISPVVLNGRLLADGGLLNPIPVAATTASTTADLTVAVSLSDVSLTAGGSAPVTDSAEPRPTSEWWGRSRRTVEDLLDSELVRAVTGWFSSDAEAPAEEVADPESKRTPYGPLPPGLGTVDVMRLSLDALQQVVTRYRLAGYPPDLLVCIPKSSSRTLDFHRAREMIAVGRERTIEALDRQELPPGD